jgi:hypothetical protein
MTTKRFSVEIPAEQIELVGSLVAGLTGTIGVTQADFMRNTIRVWGNHDSTDADSQAAVTRLVALARSGRQP